MSRPDVIAIDEMSLGLAPKIVHVIARQLALLNRERGLAVLLVEQGAILALSLCTRAYVLETGRVVAHGPSDELKNSAFVVNAYLGSPIEESA